MNQLSDTLKDYRVRTKISILSTFLLAIILLIAAITGLVRRSRQSRQAAADAQFARDAALREAQRRSASAEKTAATPYGQRSLPPASSKRHEAPPASAQGPADSNAEMVTERFSPPDLP